MTAPPCGNETRLEVRQLSGPVVKENEDTEATSRSAATVRRPVISTLASTTGQTLLCAAGGS
eukprot:5874849-Prymnesium_polylepis.1